MGALTMEQLAAEYSQVAEEQQRLCKSACVDPVVAAKMARICGVDLVSFARGQGKGWFKILKRETDQRLESFAARWRTRVDEVFVELLKEGRGPVSATALGLAGVRSLLKDSVLEDIDQWSPDAGGLLLIGQSECGKSMTALALAWRVHRAANARPPRYAPALNEEPKSPVVWTQAAYLAQVHQSRRNGYPQPEFERRCEQASLLVIDDLFFADHPFGAILHVVAVRMNAGLPTITTSGFELTDIQSKIGAAGVRRLLRVGGARGTVIAMEPSDA